MIFELPNYVKICLKTLEKAGIESYLVGGCVRDMLMGTAPHDFDITANAWPERIKPLFERTADTGIKHGTVTVIIEGRPIEITAMRTDGLYVNHRAPESVAYTSSLKEDLQRRDFTVNAVAADSSGKIYDYFGGISDLKDKTLRAVGDPLLRFDEDALRILRAFRFCSQLGFEIENATLTAALEKSHLLKNISVERIYSELGKTLLGKDPNAIFTLIDCGALEFLGLCKPNKAANIGKTVIENLPKEKSVRLAALIMLCGADENRVTKLLKTEKRTAESIKSICTLCRTDTLGTENPVQMKSLISTFGADTVYQALTVRSAVCGDNLSGAHSCLEKAKNEPIFINQLSISGNDLCSLGFSGKKIGNCLAQLQKSVWQNPELNEKNVLVDIAKTMKS